MITLILILLFVMLCFIVEHNSRKIDQLAYEVYKLKQCKNKKF